jgi:hypothetical protein
MGANCGATNAFAYVAAFSAIALLFGANLNPLELTWLIYGYLAVFGFDLFALSAGMLFAERELLH